MEEYNGMKITFQDGRERTYLVKDGFTPDIKITIMEIELKFQNKTFVWLEDKFINVNQIKYIELIK